MQDSTPELFFEAANSYHKTAAMMAAIDLGLFTAIAEGADTSGGAGGEGRGCRARRPHPRRLSHDPWFPDQGRRRLCFDAVFGDLSGRALPRLFGRGQRLPRRARVSRHGLRRSRESGALRRIARSRQHRTRQSHLDQVRPRDGRLGNPDGSRGCGPRCRRADGRRRKCSISQRVTECMAFPSRSPRRERGSPRWIGLAFSRSRERTLKSSASPTVSRKSQAALSTLIGAMDTI